MNTEFHKINLNKWNRVQYFYYFTKMLPTGYSLTSNIDITQAYNAIKNKGKKFFPAYLYICSKIISEEKEFRIGYLNDELGYYEVLHPSYSAFHNDDKSISNMWTEYDADFEVFYNNYIEDQKYASNHGIMAKPQMPPANNCMIGMTKSGHPGGSLSAADVLTYLYFCEMNVDPQHPDTFYEEV